MLFKRLKYNVLTVVLVVFYVFGPGNLNAQEEDALNAFRDMGDTQVRLKYFYSLENRYQTRSGYDWLESVNAYLDNARIVNDTVSEKKYLLMQAQILHDLGDYEKSIEKALELNEKKSALDTMIQRNLLELLDHNYAKLELFNKQVEVRQEMRQLGIKENVTFYDIYADLGMYDEAKNEYIMETQHKIDDKDYFGLAGYNYNIGNYLRWDKQHESAITKFKKARSYIELYLVDFESENSSQAREKGNLMATKIDAATGVSLAELGQYEEAISILETCISDLDEKYHDQAQAILSECRLSLAQCYLSTNELEKASDYLSIGMVLSPEMEMRRNRLMARYFERLQNYEASNLYLKRNLRINDSIKSSRDLMKNQQLNVVAGKQVELSRKLIDEQKLEMERARNELLEKEQRIGVFFVSLVLTLLSLAAFVLAYLKSIRSQRLIAHQKNIIESALVEKDSLLKEIHHRVKNNLQMVSSLLSLQTKNTRSKAAIEALEEGKSRVKAMALIHQKLYQNDDLSVIEMQGYIESLINSVQSVYKKGGHNIDLQIDAEGVELDIDRAIPFGLILNELVSNSFKYAFPDDDGQGKIKIHLRSNPDGGGFFEYTDNGIGLPDDTDERAESSMGIRLMNRLVNQLQSTLNIDKTVDGVRFWFNFK
jgi:two-component sensor histidine kinase